MDSPSKNTEVGKVQKRSVITVVGTAMAADLVQILTTSLRNLSHLC